MWIRFLEAEKDCTRGIELQPKNVKALWRRGIALRELGRISEAKRG
jgi:Flp pilus assembly protein TadD